MKDKKNIIDNKKGFGRSYGYPKGEDKVTMKCTVCKKKATKGSMIHPFCEKCFKERFKSESEYIDWLSRFHM